MRKYLWRFVTQAYPTWLRFRYGMHIGKNCRIARSAHIDKVNPERIWIGDNVWILRDAMILTHDYCRSLIADTRIGDNCIIGVRSIIMPGVTIEPGSVIGGGSVVTKNVLANTIVAGNPAKVIRDGIRVWDGKIV